ncbi:MAG: hypothetical protein FRX49_10933 [Trebouxia sp. A1-2]|nr:MAG: hypothetical protein FRX49_10933 [Trebouxia sp. A1-2]
MSRIVSLAREVEGEADEERNSPQSRVATTFLLHGTATKLQTALHGSTLWAGSVLAGPEAILNLPSAALIISGELLSRQSCNNGVETKA